MGTLALRTFLERRVLSLDERTGWRRQIWRGHAAPPTSSERSTLLIAGDAWIDFGSRTRWIAEEAWPVTAPEMARAYLSWCRYKAKHVDRFPRRPASLEERRVMWKGGYPKTLGPPCFREPCGDELVEADIVACYASLYLALSPDLHFIDDPAGPAIYPREIAWLHREAWRDLKAPRNALWGTMLAREGRRNPNFAPWLTAVTMMCLHAIAADLVDLGACVGWHGNDRVTLRSTHYDRAQEYLRHHWRLDLRGPLPLTDPGTRGTPCLEVRPRAWREELCRQWNFAEEHARSADDRPPLNAPYSTTTAGRRL